MLEAARCVKPGGVLLLLDGDFDMFHEDQVTFQEMNCTQYPHASWLARFFHGKSVLVYSVLMYPSMALPSSQSLSL